MSDATSPLSTPKNAPSDLAEVVATRAGHLVRLPPEYSREAVCELLRELGLPGSVVMGPADIGDLGSIGPDQWAVLTPPGPLRFVVAIGAPKLPNGHAVYLYPKHTLRLPPAQVPWILSALETVKPERVDAQGRPLPWTTPTRVAPAAQASTSRDADAVRDDAEVLPEAETAPAVQEDGPLATSTIREWYRQLCATLGFPEVPLVVRRGTANARGFVAGSVVMTSGFVPRRIVLTTCPNADQAEVLATLVHELAHPLSRSFDHGPAFCEQLVALAARVWGEAYAAGARARLGAPYAELDRWVACGARAALAGREPPARKVSDDGHAARVVSKVAKLWALAEDQLGKPEAVGATALANDLVTVYGLDRDQIGAGPVLDDQLTDRWILLAPRQPWQRELSHAVARFNGVYSLSMDTRARMHFFGRYSDVVAAEYLCNISIERIQRECAAHLDDLRGLGAPASEIRRAGGAFCDSAAREFARKLWRLTAESPDTEAATEQAMALEEAQHFAERELGKRGIRIGAGRTRRSRHSAEGAETGRNLQVVRGLDSQGQAPRALPERS